MTARALNVITRWVVIGPWLLWAVWELVVLALRTKIPGVRTISQEARSIAFRGLASLAYATAGMAAHWFVTWRRLPIPERWQGVCTALWWLGLAAYLLSDAVVPEARTWLRWPPAAALIGAVGAWLLFGQASVWTPGGGR